MAMRIFLNNIHHPGAFFMISRNDQEFLPQRTKGFQDVAHAPAKGGKVPGTDYQVNIVFLGPEKQLPQSFSIFMQIHEGQQFHEQKIRLSFDGNGYCFRHGFCRRNFFCQAWFRSSRKPFSSTTQGEGTDGRLFQRINLMQPSLELYPQGRIDYIFQKIGKTVLASFLLQYYSQLPLKLGADRTGSLMESDHNHFNNHLSAILALDDKTVIQAIAVL